MAVVISRRGLNCILANSEKIVNILTLSKFQQNSGKNCDKFDKYLIISNKLHNFEKKLRSENRASPGLFSRDWTRISSPPWFSSFFGIRIQNGAKECIV